MEGQKKQEADRLFRISVFGLNRIGLFQPGIMGATDIDWEDSGTRKLKILATTFYKENMYVRLMYSLRQEESVTSEFNLRISLDTTVCHYGGSRFWFICPFCTGHGKSDNLGRRVAKLYFTGRYFMCRYCGELTYKSRKISGFDRQFGKLTNPFDLEDVPERRYKGKFTKRYTRFRKKLKRFVDYGLALNNRWQAKSNTKTNKIRKRFDKVFGKKSIPKLTQ